MRHRDQLGGMTLCRQGPPRRRPQDSLLGEWVIAGVAGIALFIHLLMWCNQMQVLP